MISINDTEDSITIYKHYDKEAYQVEMLEFTDGTVFYTDDFINAPLTINGKGQLEDYMYGFGSRDNILIGSDSVDSIYGYDGDDIIIGGKGNDTLLGGTGNDTYIFNLGDGNDYINEINDGGIDKVVFGEGIAKSDIKMKRERENLQISFRNSEDSLTIADMYSRDDAIIETFEFADGTVLTAEDIFNNNVLTPETGLYDLTTGFGSRDSVLIGSDNSEYMYGNNGNDILDSGAGNDYMYGGEDDDTYIFGRGYGQDYVNDASGNDKISFKEGISLNDIAISTWYSDLVLTIAGTEDSIRIASFLYNDSYRVEAFEFSDGTIAEYDAESNSLKEIRSGSMDAVVQNDADVLDKLYSENVSDHTTDDETHMIIPEFFEEPDIDEDKHNISEITDFQVMLLAENMAAFSAENNVYDPANILENTTNDLTSLFAAAQV